MKLTPLTDHVLVQRMSDEKISGGGIIIPSSTQEKINKGVVAAVGAGRYENGILIPMSTKVGSKVIFPNFVSTEFYDEITGNKYLLMREENITAIIED